MATKSGEVSNLCNSSEIPIDVRACYFHKIHDISDPITGAYLFLTRSRTRHSVSQFVDYGKTLAGGGGVLLVLWCIMRNRTSV